MAWVTVRYGLLATAANYASWGMVFGLPFIAASWATPALLIPFTAVAALAIWAFLTSLGGQSPFSASLLDE